MGELVDLETLFGHNRISVLLSVVCGVWVISGAIFFEPLPILEDLCDDSADVGRIVSVVHLSTEPSFSPHASATPNPANILLAFKCPAIPPDADDQTEVKTWLGEIDDGMFVPIDAAIYGRYAKGMGVKEFFDEQGSEFGGQGIMIPLSVWPKLLLVLFGLRLRFNGDASNGDLGAFWAAGRRFDGHLSWR